MFWTRPIDDVLGSLSRKVSAPLRLVLWDGREYKLSESPSVAPEGQAHGRDARKTLVPVPCRGLHQRRRGHRRRHGSEASFEVHDVECLRPHYARTLEHWSRNFEDRLAQAVAAPDERTARIWRLYLAGCAYAFEQRWVSIYQVLGSKQAVSGQSDLPLTREWMYRAQ